ncbi:SAM-dependent methyltransferase [Ahniella affigens]|uniref:SAM-dependent methyltransferase n=1 Tax=Ahniella affigens TaxID=2021234 RepID=A0A2P1PM68_9GAMM|nr:class I SAM-dependent methyltransferase [Ahniella affigens]AVP95929.1 SAM-dependent methyltransferase [Ahniella affigens]
MQLERFSSDLAVIGRLLRGMSRSGSHQERLEQFYRPQAEHYDRFRERLLGGRQELIDAITLPNQARVLELGAGTGANLTRFSADRIAASHFVLVDLCPALLAVARRRWQGHPNVTVVEADAAQFDSEARFDLVVMSYALSMMPSYQAVIANAHRLLRNGGILAAVDFYTWTEPRSSIQAQASTERWFWSTWFRHDGVTVDASRLQALIQQFPSHRLVTARQPLPWLGPFRVPYFRFLGIKTR